MDDFFSTLATDAAAAGTAYYSSQLAQATNPAVATTTSTPIIAGISNQTLLIVGAAILAVILIAK